MPHFHPIRSGNLWFWDPILPHLNSNRFGNSIFSDNRCIRFPWEQTLRFTFAQIRTWPIFSTTDLKIHLFCNADVPFFIHFFFQNWVEPVQPDFFEWVKTASNFRYGKTIPRKKLFQYFFFCPFLPFSFSLWLSRLNPKLFEWGKIVKFVFSTNQVQPSQPEFKITGGWAWKAELGLAGLAGLA